MVFLDFNKVVFFFWILIFFRVMDGSLLGLMDDLDYIIFGNNEVIDFFMWVLVLIEIN